MSDITQVAHVLRTYPSFRRKPGSRGGGKPHLGLRLLKNADLDRVAERILRRSWHNRKVASSMFKMAQYVESALDLKLKWLECYHLARLLMSSLTFAGIYKCVQENSEDSFSPYVIHSLSKSLMIGLPLINRIVFCVCAWK